MPVVLPLLAFGAAYAVIRSAKSQSSEVSTDTAIPMPAGQITSLTFDSLIEEMRGDLPSDFLRRWMARESGGNPCSIGVYGGPWEVGIGQLYFDKDESQKSLFGATLSELRAYCDGATQTQTRELTDDEKRQNVSATLIGPANHCLDVARSRLSSTDNVWNEQDTLCLAKLYHALPVLVTNHLSVASQDGQTESWDSYRGYLGNMTRTELAAFDQRAGYQAGYGAAPHWPIDKWFDNAQYVGRG